MRRDRMYNLERNKFINDKINEYISINFHDKGNKILDSLDLLFNYEKKEKYKYNFKFIELDVEIINLLI